MVTQIVFHLAETNFFCGSLYKILDPAVHGRGRRRLRCACWWHTSIMGGYYVSMNASCADGQNLKIVRCNTFQGRWYPDFWRVPKNPLNRSFFSRGIYYVFWSSDSHSEGFFFTVSPKVLGKVVGSGQNKNLPWECDHWTKVRLRRDKGKNMFQTPYYSHLNWSSWCGDHRYSLIIHEACLLLSESPLEHVNYFASCFRIWLEKADLQPIADPILCYTIPNT